MPASAICTRPLTPVITTSTMVKDEWKWRSTDPRSPAAPAKSLLFPVANLLARQFLHFAENLGTTALEELTP
jgi:hypothetical protein